MRATMGLMQQCGVQAASAERRPTDILQLINIPGATRRASGFLSLQSNARVGGFAFDDAHSIVV